MPTISIQPSTSQGKDTYILSDGPTFNAGAHPGMTTSASTIRKGLIYFDLSFLPASAVINSAELILYNLSSGSGTVGLHRSLVDWFEGVQTGAAPGAGEDGSTWNLRNANGSVAWAGGAGGGSGSDYSSSSFSSKSATSGYNTWNVATEVSAIAAGTATNRGWWIIQTSGSTNQWAASDHTDPTLWPELVINYTVAGELSTTIQPDGTAGNDTFLDSSATTTNFGTNAAIQAGDVQSAGTQNIRSLLKFDLSSIPANAIIHYAEIALFENAATGTGTWELRFQRLLRNWVESQATWNNYSTGNAWTTAGAGADGTDRSATHSIAEIVDGTAALAFVTFTSPTLIDDVKKMHNGTYSNFGWLVHAPNAETTNPGARTVWTSSDGTSSQRPKLIVYYTDPNIEGTAAGTSTASASLSAYGNMAGSAAGSATVEAEIVQPGSRTATVTTTSTLTGTLSASTGTVGAIISTSTLTGTMTATGNLPAGSASGQATATATIYARVRGEVSIHGASILAAEATFQGQLRAMLHGTSSFTAGGWAKATGKKRVELCDNDPLLYITDGTLLPSGQLNRLNLIDPQNGFSLYDWRPNIAQYKNAGYWSDSALGQGRRLSRRVFANAIEIMTLKAKSYNQNLLIAFTREYFGWQEAAADYWTSEWAVLPVYLVARSPRETQTRYATIHMMSIPELENPYGQPFFGRGKPAFENITLRIERDDWTSQPPGEFECVEVSSLRSWTVSGWVSS